MIEIWKLQREAKRLAMRTSALFLHPIEVLRHRRSRKPTLPAFDVQTGQKVAIFVVYQPNGLAVSTVQTVAHLAENGFAVFVVSNGRLSAQDRDALAVRAPALFKFCRSLIPAAVAVGRMTRKPASLRKVMAMA